MDRNMTMLFTHRLVCEFSMQQEKINNKLLFNMMKRNLLKLLTVVIAIFSICGSVSAQTGKEIGLISGALEWKSVTDATHGNGYKCSEWEGVTVSLFKGTCSGRDVNEPKSYMGQNGGMVLVIDGGSQNMTTITLDYSSGSGFNHGLVPSSGTVTVDEATRTTTWTGNANKVVFTTDYAENLYNKYERIFVYTDGATSPDIPASLTNTATTAYSVTKARELLTKYKKANNMIYVKGKVSYIKEFLSKYGSITYYISETGDPSEPQFMIYSGKNVNNTQFSSKDDLQIGDEVTVYGEMRYYGLDLELYQNNYIVNYKSVLDAPFELGTYYFRNAEAGTFLAGGNSWGTKLSLKSAGDPIQVTKDGEGYILRDLMKIGGNTGDYIAQADGEDMFIDQRTTPVGGIKFTRLSVKEIRWYNSTYSTKFDENKAYYFIHYDSKTGGHVYMQCGNVDNNWAGGGSGHTLVVGKGLDEETGKPNATAVWEIMTRQQLIDDLYNNASPENMMSATPFIMNPDFSRNCNADGNANNNHWTVVNTITNVYGANQNFIAAAENKAFNLYQKITDLPNGNYAILAQGVFLGTKTGTGINPRFYVKDASTTYSKQLKWIDGGSTDLAVWSKNFYDNPRNTSAEVGSNKDEYLYTLDSIYVTVYDHTLTIGFEGERTDVRAYFDNVQLIYKGKADDLNELAKKYNQLRSQGSALRNKDMSKAAKDNLNNGLLLSPNMESIEELNAAIAELSQIVSDAKESNTLYATLVSKYDAEVAKLSSTAMEYYDNNIRKPIITAGLLENEQQLIDGVSAARIINAGPNADITELLLSNPDFETGDVSGWTVDGSVGGETGAKGTSTNPYPMSNSNGSWLYNTWNNGGVGYPIWQKTTGLAKGKYTLTAVMASTAGVTLNLTNGKETAQATGQGDPTGIVVKLDFNVNKIEGITVKAYATEGSATNYRYFKVDNFHLIYNGNVDVTEIIDKCNDIVDNATIELQAKMNDDVKDELTGAQLELKNLIKNGCDDADKLQEAYDRVEAALKKAQESAYAYEKIKNIFDNVNDPTTGLDAAGKAEFEKLTEDIKKRYENGTITDGKAELEDVKQALIPATKAQTTPGKEMTNAVINSDCTSGYVKGQFGWADRAKAVAVGWHVLDADHDFTELNVPDNFHVNTWSTEADDEVNGDHTPMIAPFTEFWSGAADRVLQQHNYWIAHLPEAGYKPGRYTIGIMARLGQFDTAGEGPKNYKFVANGVESSTKYTEASPGVWYAWDELDFYVEEDGIINFEFRLNHPNFSWLSFKMLKLIYQGETVDEESAQKMLANAKEYEDVEMNKDVQATLMAKIESFEGNMSISSSKELTKALQDAVNSAQMYEDILDDIETYKNKASLSFNDVGMKLFDEKIKEINNEWNNGTLTESDKNRVQQAYLESLKGQGAGADLTELIINPSFESGATGWTGMGTANPNFHAANNGNWGDYTVGTWFVEGWVASGNRLPNMEVYQVITDLPNGQYKVSANMKGVQQSDGSSQLGFYLMANNSLQVVRTEVGEVVEVLGEVTDGTLKIGYKTENTGCNWACVDDFHLTYVKPTDKDDILAQLQNTSLLAKDLIDKPMNKDIKNPLMSAYYDAMEADNSTSEEEINELTKTINSLVDPAKESIKLYEKVNSYIEKAIVLDSKGIDAFDALAKADVNLYNRGEINNEAGSQNNADSVCNRLEEYLVVATKKQTSNNANWTGAIRNNGFENHMVSWRTNDGYRSFSSAKVSDNPWEAATGSRYAYRDNGNATDIKVNIEQVIDHVQAGIYRLKATIRTNSNTMELFGSGINTSIPKCGDGVSAVVVEQVAVSWVGEDFSVGVIGTLKKGESIAIDNLELEFVSSEIDISEEVIGDDVKMNKEVRAAQNVAYEAFKKRAQPKTLSDAIEAIHAAQESAAAYAMAKHFADSAMRYMANSNVYSSRAYKLCTGMINNLLSRYEAETLTTKDIMGTNGKDGLLYEWFQNDFETFNDQIAQDEDSYSNYPILYYLFDAWDIDKYGSTIKADDTFHVNTWSKEVNKENPLPENSEMIPPFIEYWNHYTSLEDASIHGTALDLEPGLYRVKAYFRAMDESDHIAPEDLEGITFRAETHRYKETGKYEVVPNGKYVTWSTEATDVCSSGNVYKDGTHNVLAGEVYIDSLIIREKDIDPKTNCRTAELYFDINNSNVTWFAFKFVKLEKIRDLNFDEENDLATEEEKKDLKDYVARDNGKAIGFTVGQYPTFENREIIMAHNEAVEYIKENDAINHMVEWKVVKLNNTLYEDPLDPTTSKWKSATTDYNIIYNPNFWILEQDMPYSMLFGWEAKDNSIENPMTGVMGGAFAKADNSYKNFNNIEGSEKFTPSGEPHVHSTAAELRFDKFMDNSTVLTKYIYGSTEGYEMPLDPGQTYSFSGKVILSSTTDNSKPHTAIISIRQKYSGDVIKKIEVTPTVHLADTSAIPQPFQIYFDTKKPSPYYRNELSRFDDLDFYEIVIESKDKNPENGWGMAISNLKLYRHPNTNMFIKEGAHWGTFIAPFAIDIKKLKDSGVNVSAYAVVGKEPKEVDEETGIESEFTMLTLTQSINLKYTDKDGEQSHNYNLANTIPAYMPVVIFTEDDKGIDKVVSGQFADYYRGEVCEYRINNEHVYLKGQYGDLFTDADGYTVVQPKQIPAPKGSYILQKHENRQTACFYIVDEQYLSDHKYKHPNINTNRCWLVDPLVEAGGNAKVRRFVFDLDEVLEMTTSIENSENQNDEIKIIGIYSANGAPQKTLQSGINIIKLSNGTTVKKFIK